MLFVFALLIVFYSVPFLFIAVMPGWRSFGVAASVGIVALGMLWSNNLRHRFDPGGNGLASAFGDIALHVMTAGVLASIIGRAIALKRQDSSGDPSPFAVMAFFFLFGPFLALF